MKDVYLGIGIWGDDNHYIVATTANTAKAAIVRGWKNHVQNVNKTADWAEKEFEKKFSQITFDDIAEWNGSSVMKMAVNVLYDEGFLEIV